MTSQVFINLAVSDLEQSMNLYQKMGFELNPQFSDESSKCLVWSESIFVMIMNKDKFSSFATKPLADTKSALAGIYALSVENRDRIDEIMESALGAGGTEPKPLQDHGFMQLRTVEDFDGHTWEIFYMDMSQFPSS